MTQTPLNKIEARTAAEVCARFELSEEAASSPPDGLTPGAFLDRLLERGLHLDALRFLAHAMPKREVVWWAACCTRIACGSSLSPEQQAALEAAERWCAEPSDERRRGAMAAAEAAKFDNPAGCVALAAFLSGGSLAPPELPAVPPADDLTAKAAACGVSLAGVISEPEKAAEKYRRFAEQGMAVARGAETWK